MLDQYKDGALVETLQLSASKRVYKVGRQAGFADVVLAHASISREHATLTVSASGSVVVCDLGSAHGTSISGKRLPANKPHLLAPGRSLQFGASSRIFKLRADSTGFLTAAGGAASAPPPQTQSARAEALEKALLDALRHGALDGDRLRPDGFVRLDAALGCAALAAHRPPPTEREVRELVAAGGAVASGAPLELRDEGGAALIRATSGHAEALGVDASLRLRAATADELRGAGTLVHGAPFLEYNSIRSRGLAGPARFWRRAPAKGEKPHGLKAAPHILVYVRTASLVDGGSAVYVEEAGADGGADAAEEPAFVCAGDADVGAVGPWHFDRVVNARDGSALMEEEEIAPLRAARAAEIAARREAEAAKEAKVAAKAEAKAAKAEASARAAAAPQWEDMPEEEEEPAERFNPYLQHLGATVSKASNRSNAAPELVRKRKWGEGEEGSGEEDE